MNHKETAAELERTIRVIANMADNIGSLAAYKEAEHQEKHLTKLADWHRKKANIKSALESTHNAAPLDQKKQELQRLGDTAKRTLGKFPQTGLNSY